MTQSFHIKVDSEEMGPFSKMQIFIWLENGELKKETPMRAVNSVTWQTVEHFWLFENSYNDQMVDSRSQKIKPDRTKYVILVVFILLSVPILFIFSFAWIALQEAKYSLGVGNIFGYLFDLFVSMLATFVGASSVVIWILFFLMVLIVRKMTEKK